MSCGNKSFAETRTLQDFHAFGVDVVETTRNGVWIEQRHTRAGKLMRQSRLAFLGAGMLEALLKDIERKGRDND